MPKKNNKAFKNRSSRQNLSISPISGLESYFCDSQQTLFQNQCVIWNVSTGGACILLNGHYGMLNIGDKCILKCYAPFEKKEHEWKVEVKWINKEIFVTFVGLSFEETDHARDNFFYSFRQIE